MANICSTSKGRPGGGGVGRSPLVDFFEIWQTRHQRPSNRLHELLLWLIPQLDRLPRVRQFTLGERIEVAIRDVLERLVEAAAYSRDKRAPSGV